MGLRFRKSISLFPGVKLNFGTTGMSISAGVPGFRKTFHTSGRVTTSIGIPGTGLYYVDTKNSKEESTALLDSNRSTLSKEENSDFPAEVCNKAAEERFDGEGATVAGTNMSECSNALPSTLQFDAASLRSIHKTSDDTIDWTEVMVSSYPPDDSYNPEAWKYYHQMAPKVLSGDIDVYLQLIYEVNPLDDLLAYGGNYEFGTDDPRIIEVEFTVNEDSLASLKKHMSTLDYNRLTCDYISSVCIRIARDMFALLPIIHTIVHAKLREETVVSVDFNRENLSKIKFSYTDPFKTLQLFPCHIQYDDDAGFSPVMKLEYK